jgi:hypothetical protein
LFSRYHCTKKTPELDENLKTDDVIARKEFTFGGRWKRIGLRQHLLSPFKQSSFNKEMMLSLQQEFQEIRNRKSGEQSRN